MTMSDQGIPAERWMKRYLSSVEARDIYLSFCWMNRWMASWSLGKSVERKGRFGGSVTDDEFKERVSMYQRVIVVGPGKEDIVVQAVLQAPVWMAKLTSTH